MDVLAALFPLALAALAAVGVLALRRPILASMAWRNARRRPRQSVLIVLGLLIGTAIIGGALVTSDSMEYAIVEATLDAFQEIDETVYLDGYAFFPRAVERQLAADPILGHATDAVGSNILWDTSITNERTQQFEPNARMVGFDPEEDPDFGVFRSGGRRLTGAELAEDDVYLHRDLARSLEAQVGDRLTVHFSRPLDPTLPAIDTYVGRFDVAVTAPGPLPIDPPRLEPRPWSQAFRIDGTVLHLTAVLLWIPDPGVPQDLDLVVVDPEGREHANLAGSADRPDLPVFVNVTGSLAQPLPRGDWTLRVHAKAAVNTEFNVTLLRFEPIYDLQSFQRRAEELRQRFPSFAPEALETAFHREERSVRVAAIVDGGKGPNFKLPTALNLFVRLDALQSWLDRADQVNFVKVSNPGGVEEGAERSSEVYPLLYERLNATKQAFPHHPAVAALKAGNDKVFWLDQARDVGEVFSIFLTFVGSFSIIAGLLLIVNLFTMLAEERKMELGVSRAVGLLRHHVTRLFLFEGAMYALPAAVLGTLAGLGLARGLILGFNAFGDTESFPPVPFRLETRSLFLAFAVGTLLTLLTVYVGARRVSRLNVVRAIRRLDEPETSRSRGGLASGLLLLTVGLAATIAALARDDFPLSVVGPLLLVVGAAVLLRRRFHRRVVYPPLAGVLFAYYAYTYFTQERLETVLENVVSPIRAVLMALCVVVIVVYNERTTRWLGALALRVRGLRAVALPATSYPLHRKFRTGLTLAMFSVVLLTVILFSIFGAIFAPDWRKESGGYDVEATTQTPLADLEAAPHLLERMEGYEALPFFRHIGGTLITINGRATGEFGPPQDFVWGIDEGFAQHNRFRLHARDPAYASDADAYAAVARDPGLVIVAYQYSTDEERRDDAFGPGDRLEIEAKGGRRAFTIVGVQEQFHFKGVFVAKPAVRELFADLDTLFLVRLRPEVDDMAFAQDLEAAFRPDGMNAESIRIKVLRENEQFRQITTLVQLFLGLGLVVGILSLGIVTARSVVERRQEIGMLRALGYRRRDVRRTFLLETVTTITLGVGIGAVVALLVSFATWYSLVREFRIPYQVPWVDVLVIAGLAYVATTLATLAPIAKAARTPPADALRYIE